MLVARPALSDPSPSLDLRRFYPPADADGTLALEPAVAPGPGAWSLRVLSSYARRLVVVRSESDATTVPLEHQVAVDYLASVGLGGRWAASLALPSIVVQSGDDLHDDDGPSSLPRSALGDAQLGLKVTLVPPTGSGLALAGLADVTIPVGDERSYLGEGAATGELRILGELARPRWSWRAMTGVRLRADPETYLGERFGHDVPWAIGIAGGPKLPRPVGRRPWEAFLDLHGAVALAPEFGAARHNPALTGLGARYVAGDASFFAGVELPLAAAVGVPQVRGVLGLEWAPRFFDADDDGVPDERDACPEVAEDLDGVKDGDGCVDPDNDGDGLLDVEDQCPDDPEDEDGFADDDGCPDPDNDRDGVPDRDDECPDTPGEASAQGCEIPDTDGDGVIDTQDWCPTQPEDRDGYQDQDGCPDLDDDGDGVPDTEDACRHTPGTPGSEPEWHGCPNPDRDGDTYEDGRDGCPDEPEDFDGDRDEDGCRDEDSPPGARPLVAVRNLPGGPTVRWRLPIRLERRSDGTVIAADSLVTLRALAQLANEHPRWVLVVGVRPRDDSEEAQQSALTASFALVAELRRLTHRDSMAESVAWGAVATTPGAAATGIGVAIISAEAP